MADWAFHQPEVRFDIRAERAEYEYLFNHQARVLQDRLARRGGGDRTKEIPIKEGERVYRKEAQAVCRTSASFKLGQREKAITMPASCGLIAFLTRSDHHPSGVNNLHLSTQRSVPHLYPIRAGGTNDIFDDIHASAVE